MLPSIGTKTKAYVILSVLLLYFAVVFSFWLLEIRSISPRINFLSYTLALALPLSCFYLSKYYELDKPFIRLFTVMSIVTVPMLVLWVFATFSVWPSIILTDTNPIFELMTSEKRGDKYVRVYRTNYGGALSGYGVKVREEKEFLPGVYATRVLYSANRYSSIQLYNSDGTIKIVR